MFYPLHPSFRPGMRPDAGHMWPCVVMERAPNMYEAIGRCRLKERTNLLFATIFAIKIGPRFVQKRHRKEVVIRLGESLFEDIDTDLDPVGHSRFEIRLDGWKISVERLLVGAPLAEFDPGIALIVGQAPHGAEIEFAKRL